VRTDGKEEDEDLDEDLDETVDALSFLLAGLFTGAAVCPPVLDGRDTGLSFLTTGRVGAGLTCTGVFFAAVLAGTADRRVLRSVSVRCC
jgi:hypothetical protein